MSTTEEGLQLDQEDVRTVRDALLIGLASLGSIESAINAASLKTVSGELPRDGTVPMHPTGNSDTVSLFAEALRIICR